VKPFYLTCSGDTSTSGDAPSPELERDESTPISEDKPLADAAVQKDALSGEIEPDEAVAVPNSGEPNGGLRRPENVIHPVGTDFPRGGNASSAFSARCAAVDEKPSVTYTIALPLGPKTADRMAATRRRGGYGKGRGQGARRYVTRARFPTIRGATTRAASRCTGAENDIAPTARTAAAETLARGEW